MSNKVSTSLSPTMKLSIIAAIFMLISAILIRPPENNLAIFEEGMYHPYPMIKDSLKTIEINDDISLNIVTDTTGNVYFYTLKDEELLTSGLIANNNDLEGEMYWVLKQPATIIDATEEDIRSERERQLFIGMITNAQIDNIAVNGINSDIQYFDYRGYKYFYTTEQIDEYAILEGFSSENDLVYQNEVDSISD
ncbi:hypothetical protein V1503_07590 [Bacillus sp. SCS-151]|uniref:hypothetical protein n=1 Tax=Nanhaiella sioensis TaxID=3115293 RepID=UPI00397A9136